jgi:hypothetical protein
LNLERRKYEMTLRIVSLAALIVTVAMLVSPCIAQSPGSPPEKIDATYPLAPDPSACAFPVTLHVTGKSKAISLPGNRTVITAPGQDVTVTNLNNLKQVTFNITGVFTFHYDSEGGFVAVGTGRNLVTDPGYGLTLVIGKFSWAMNSAGQLVQGLTPQGGQTISVCSMVD